MIDITKVARDAGLTVVLDGKIGTQEYQSVSGSLAALQRFADGYYKPTGDAAKTVEKLLNRAALQFEDEDAAIMREAARMLQRDHYVHLAHAARASASTPPTRYFVYDNDGGYEEFATDAERAAHHHDAIQTYLDDGWSEEVKSVVSGTVTHKTVQTNLEQQPARCQEHADADGEHCEACDAWNEWPDHSFDTTCSYEAEPIASGDAAAAPFPDELTPELREVLGWPNFKCGPVAHVMVAAGAVIKPKAEDEQAVVLHWLVKLVLKHGADWWTIGRDELREMQQRIKQAAAGGDHATAE
ncbi:hypothetical protein DWV00_08615 [Trinickia dinghuensis]|uniref:Uncharacterized protein n=2 Tax=Trinickia dinghuensis TaxID=2291023 RepID=A0A3D8K1I9_9BURK|nr:hypothetical protein DWV00_08615 [Trinickia dinghuensis]